MESKFTVTCNADNAEIELCGRLDATNSPVLQEELKKLAGKNIKKLNFNAKDLEYISSAGLRVIIFAKQKLGVDTHVFLNGAQ
ncbi:MAG: STAS domain-containing protein, partial [Candidatus Omnitrophica bacterium]|nr:STAS domain-containing protein [Candidatus Omnitrophota bacterium]